MTIKLESRSGFSEMSFLSVAVIGYGTVGKTLVNDLLAKGIQVLIISRDTRNLKDLPSASRLNTVSVDYTDEKQVAQVLTVHAVDVVVCTLGSSYYSIVETQVQVGRAAKEARVKLFIPSEFGLFQDGYPEDSIFGAKSIAAARLKEIGIPTTRIINGAFTEGLFFMVSTDSRPGEFVIAGKGETKISFTSLTDVTGYVAHILTTLPLISLKDRIFLIEGQAVSLLETAQILHKDVTYLTFDDIENPVTRALQEAADAGYARSGFKMANKDAPLEVVNDRSSRDNALWEGHVWKNIAEVHRADTI